MWKLVHMTQLAQPDTRRQLGKAHNWGIHREGEVERANNKLYIQKI